MICLFFFIKLLCPQDGLIVDPFAGSGTTGIAALSANRRYVLIDNNPDYCQTALGRLRDEGRALDEELAPIPFRKRASQMRLCEKPAKYKAKRKPTKRPS